MRNVAQIVEMDQERDRKTCLALDQKVTGANRELAQWLLDHPRYPNTAVAGWLGCGETRIRELRTWAKDGFVGLPHSKTKRNSRPDANAALKTNNNSEDENEEEKKIGQQNLYNTLLYNVEMAIKCATDPYHGPINAKLIKKCRHAAKTWNDLADRLEKETHS